MILGGVSAEEMQAAQLLTGVTLALFIGAALVPRHAIHIRIAALVLYGIGMVGFLVHFLLR
jgi:hypothetical protein